MKKISKKELRKIYPDVPENGVLINALDKGKLKKPKIFWVAGTKLFTLNKK